MSRLSRFPMSDELRRLREHEIGLRGRLPRGHRFDGGRTVEAEIHLGGWELCGVPARPIFLSRPALLINATQDQGLT